jgi:hypothetical protein
MIWKEGCATTKPGRLLVITLLVSLSASLTACGKPQITGDPGMQPTGMAGAPGPGRATPGASTDGPGFTLPPPGDPGAPDAGAPPASLPPMGESCAEEAHDGKLVPLDLLFLVDISGSMEESAGAQSKWVALRDALQSFINDPKSEGLGAGLLFFPPPARRCANNNECPPVAGQTEVCEQKGVCSEPAMVAVTEPACNASVECTSPFGAPCTIYGLCSKTGLRCTNMGMACPTGVAADTCTPRPRMCVDDRIASCQEASYETPVVPIGNLPGRAAMLADTLNATVPQGGTPTTPAVTGALRHLQARASADPSRKPVLVLATDGVPSGCGFRDSPAAAAAALMGARAAAPGVSTYVIGVFSQAQLLRAQPVLSQLATAGGTVDPFIIATGTDLSQRFLQAINQIRGTALGCEFIIPPPTRGTIDFEKVNVRYMGPTGPDDLRYVTSADRCDATRGGWYYDTDPAAARPTRVLLCPATCARVKDTAGVSVQLRFGCKTRVE